MLRAKRIRYKLTFLASIAVLISVPILLHAQGSFLFDLRILKTARFTSGYLELTLDTHRVMIPLLFLGIVFVILGVAFFGAIFSAIAVMNRKATRK